MSSYKTTGARATGLATLAADGTVLDTWFPAPELADGIAASSSTRLSEAEAVAALGADVALALSTCAIRGTTVVAVRTEIKSLADLKAMAARPEGVSFASAGNGTSGHLAGELLAARLGGKMVHVPYSQGGQALTDVMGGQVQFMFYHPAAVLPHLKSGKLRALGASSARRSEAAASDSGDGGMAGGPRSVQCARARGASTLGECSLL